MALDDKKRFDNKKTAVSFVLSVLVFFIHFRVFSVFSSIEGGIKRTFDILLSMTHIAVPLFFLISGVMLYRNYTLNKTLEKWKNRFFSLVIPYLIWNTVWFLVAVAGYYTPLGKFTGGLKVKLSLNSALQGIFLHGQFEPFWFMLQLIVLTILCPFIYLMLRNKYIGVVNILLIYILYGCGFRFDETLFADTSMVIYYLVGAYIGLHYYSWFTSHKSNKQSITCLLIYIICCMICWIQNLFIGQNYWNFVMPVVKICSVLSTWIAFDLLDFQEIPAFLKESFLVYAMHSFVGAAIAKIMSILLPVGKIYVIINAIITFIATIVLICTFGVGIKKYMPKIHHLITGR